MDVNFKQNPSKDILARTFKELLTKRSFHKISIEEIAAAAGLSRQTFYRNFCDKYDALSYLYASDINPVLEEYGSDIREVAAKVLKYFREHDYIYRDMGCDFSMPNPFLNFWVEYTFHYMMPYIGKRRMNAELDLALRLYLHGCYYIHYQYMTNSIKGAPEEVSRLIINNLPEIVKPYFQL